jgi:hypothetical protein
MRMINPGRKQAIRIVAAGAFSLAALIWLAVTAASTSERPLHIATTVLLAAAAGVWLVSYLIGRSNA